MAVMDRVAGLSRRHAELDEMLLKESARPLPDEAEIKRLKVAKLQIKDQIAALTAH